MLEWIRIRDDVTCEVYYKLWDENVSKYVAGINKVGSRFRVQILDHAPFHAKKLQIAKDAGEHIYEQVCVGNNYATSKTA
jgi:hypothetical protein